MLRKLGMAVAVTVLGLGAAQARADHDRELRYLVGGALVGAAIGSLAYHSRHSHPAPVVISYEAGYRPNGYRAYRERPYRPHRYCGHPGHRRFGRHGHHY